ncbi:iron-only hydrogenase maturation protein HydF [Lachnospiraceae bacterium C10]|nr:iron-only hydrogenase maturation protein HydF [Lachnospiraceae bacterium C10]
MGLNDTPSGERVQIGIFGRTNAGKSSLMNVLTGQQMAVVSDIKGTTTDPVRKSMELLPIGPVTFIDTPGLDDDSELGEERIKKMEEVLRKVDVALYVLPAGEEPKETDKETLLQLRERKIPFLVVLNKVDLLEDTDEDLNLDDNNEDRPYSEAVREHLLEVGHHLSEDDTGMENGLALTEDELFAMSAHKDAVISANFLRIRIAQMTEKMEDKRRLVADLLKHGDHMVVVIPIDAAAPKGRLILPEQQVIRDALDDGIMVSVVQPQELPLLLHSMKKDPELVVTDSQAFGAVSEMLPRRIPLTSFSILMSRYKGDLQTQVSGARKLDTLEDGDKILVCEGCTHHRQCGDIGTEKLPNWIRKYTGKEFDFTFTSGGDYPDNLEEYKLVVHCGGCTLPKREMRYRIDEARRQGVAITNYGVLIAQMHGILGRVLSPFPSDELK